MKNIETNLRKQICTRCKKEKSLSCFGKRRYRENIRWSTECKVCLKIHNNTYYAAHAQQIQKNHKRLVKPKYALIVQAKSRPCKDCGGLFPPCVMDFDHVRGKKLFDVGNGRSRSEAAIAEEIAKCEVICANCHRLRTWVH